MKEYVVEIRRFGELVFAGHYSAKSFNEAVDLAGCEYLAVHPSEILPDRLGAKFNPGWICYYVSRSVGYRLLVKDV